MLSQVSAPAVLAVAIALHVTLPSLTSFSAIASERDSPGGRVAARLVTEASMAAACSALVLFNGGQQFGLLGSQPRFLFPGGLWPRRTHSPSRRGWCTCRGRGLW